MRLLGVIEKLPTMIERRLYIWSSSSSVSSTCLSPYHHLLAGRHLEFQRVVSLGNTSKVCHVSHHPDRRSCSRTWHHHETHWRLAVSLAVSIWVILDKDSCLLRVMEQLPAIYIREKAWLVSNRIILGSSCITSLFTKSAHLGPSRHPLLSGRLLFIENGLKEPSTIYCVLELALLENSWVLPVSLFPMPYMLILVDIFFSDAFSHWKLLC